MSADPSIALGDLPDDDHAECWCCGTTGVPEGMVSLGTHPEVHLCLGCAHYVHQRAWQIEDKHRQGPTAAARKGVRAARAAVIQRGWHQNRFIGGALRWLGKHLP